MFDTLFVTGLSIVPVALTALGLAMLNAPGFGRRLARMSIGSAVFTMIIFNLVAGWKTYTLSRAPRTAIITDRLTATSTR